MFWNVFAFLASCAVCYYNFAVAKSVIWGAAAGAIAVWQLVLVIKYICEWHGQRKAGKEIAHKAEVERMAQSIAKKMMEEEKKKKAEEEERRRRQEESEQRIAEAAARIVVEKMKKER